MQPHGIEQAHAEWCTHRTPRQPKTLRLSENLYKMDIKETGAASKHSTDGDTVHG